MVVIGFERKSFKGTDGNIVNGYDVYCGTPARDGGGYRVDRFFLSETRCNNSGYIPREGDHISFVFNRYGKVAEIAIVEE